MEDAPIPFQKLSLDDRLRRARAWDKPRQQGMNFVYTGCVGVGFGVFFVVIGFAVPAHENPLTSLQTYPLLDPYPLQGIGIILFLFGLLIIGLSLFFRKYYRDYMLYLVEDPTYFNRNPQLVATPRVIARIEKRPDMRSRMLDHDTGSLVRSEVPIAERTPANSEYAQSEKSPTSPMEEIDLGAEAATVGRAI